MEKKFAELMDLYEEIKREVRRRDPHLYDRWKAGGFIVDRNIVSMYPCLEEVVESLSDEEDDEDDGSENVFE